MLLVDDTAVLIDFDWCGKVGEVRYPNDITLGPLMDWHDGVQRGGLIHDDAHLLRVLTGEEL